MSRGRNRSQRDGDVSSEEVELEAAENLLSRLKRQYRMMERNRRQYYDETTVLLTKQRKMLSDLEQEKNKLEENLKLSSAPKNKFRDIDARNSMSAILERQEHYENLIEDEKSKIKELDANITNLEKQLRDMRRKVPSTKHLETEREIAKASNVILENRIQQATVRLNAILAENSKLRNDIENLLKERDKFLLQQARRLEKQLAMTSKKKSDIMDQVTKAYTEREEAQSKMRSLKDRINRDTLKYSNEMKKIQRAIDYQTNLRSFVNTIATGEEEEIFKKRQEEDLEEGGIEMTLENYRSSIAHLEETSREFSTDILISNYLQAENDNYTLFSYISDLNNEVTAVAGDVTRLQQEIDDVQGKGSQTERDNNCTLGNLREKLLKVKKEVSILEDEEKKAKETLTEINTVTSNLFYLLECDPKPVQTLVGGSEVTSSNLSVFLSVIEQKVQEFCQVRDALREKEDDLLSPRQTQNANEIANDGQSESVPSSVMQTRPAIPHVAHTSEDDVVGPTTHRDLLSSLRLRWSDSFEG